MLCSRVNQESYSTKSRLLRKQGYGRILGAEKIVGGQLKVFFSANPAGISRLGIIASKKNFVRAVDRNRIKRLIRETFRRHVIKASPVDIVVSVGRTYAWNSKANIVILGILFDQIKIKCASS